MRALARSLLDPAGVQNWNGAVAQLGERVVRNDEVRGSIPLGSTSFPVCFRPQAPGAGRNSTLNFDFPYSLVVRFA
jgi:hypothetical protein